MVNNQHKKSKKYYIIKFIIFVLLSALLVLLIKINYNDAQRKTSLENTIADITSLSSKQTFSIDKIYLYSSANATNNETKKSMWNLNVYQYTDIALYISANSSNSDQNTIKELYIDNVKFDSLSTGTPNLHYKNLFEFGKFSLETDNLITDRLNYEVVEPAKAPSSKSEFRALNTEVNAGSDTSNSVTNTESDGSGSENDIFNSAGNMEENSITSDETSTEVSAETLDYTKPQIYSDASNPITLEYVNLIKSNYLVSDIEKPLVYNGSLLKRAGIDPTSISCNISFKVHIKNNLDENHVATVKISIPLKDDVAGTSIYDGSFTKEITTKTNFNYEK